MSIERQKDVFEGVFVFFTNIHVDYYSMKNSLYETVETHTIKPLRLS